MRCIILFKNYNFQTLPYLLFTGPLGPRGPEDLVIVPDITPPTDQPSTEQPTAEEDVRTFFPESWIFTLKRAE